MKNKYDVIVIGSGCGGAAAAALLSSLGNKTLLVEKSRRIGGRTATYEKKGFKLDHGHVLMRSQKGPHGEVLRLAKCKDLIPPFSVCRNWAVKSIIADKPLEIRQNVYSYVLSSKGRQQLGAFGFTPTELANMVRWNLVRRTMPEKKIRRYDHVDMHSYMKNYIDNKYISAFYGGLAVVLFGALDKETSAGESIRMSQAGFKDFLNMGYPVTGEGISAIPKSFIRAAERYGADVELGCPVKNVVVENGKAKGVRINGETIWADSVVSNIGVRETVDKLVGPEHFDSVYVNRIRNLKYSYGGVSLKFALDKWVTPWVWGGVMPDKIENINQDLLDGKVPETLPMMYISPSKLDPALAPPGKQVLSVISGAPISKNGNGDMDWDLVAAKLKKQVEDFFPGIAESTVFCDVSTPKDISKSTGRAYGDAIGVSQTIDQVGMLRPSKVSPIQGLYYVGADVGRGNVASELASESAISLYRRFKKKQNLLNRFISK
ncbi:phytoene desaturase family protein [Desulfatibacillum aliphaticivorans]|uniref:phytoene desaturase family protein n=1 Tax=Desulfatibacillum aliphaticivorans TaxID=218208 RepID=UPI000428EC7F|nr:NAD(P)/FAD-dependent oxidoreductase [Desulfatibacillum aliphaticivorans]